MCVYLYNVYIYISGQKWSTADGVLKSHRSKIGLIYMCNHENNVPSGLSLQWLWTTHALRYMVYIMSPSLWVATKPLWWYPGGHIVFMIEYINIYIYIYIYIYKEYKEWSTHSIFCIPDSWNKMNPIPILYSIGSCPK